MGARFGNKTVFEIRNAVKESQCRNTARTQDSIWKQFTEFCEIRKFPLNKAVEMNEVASILEDYAFNANRKDGSEYKEATLKTIWNTTAKLVQQLYFKKFNITMNPFMDIDFESARKARDSRRKKLQAIPGKRKISSCAIDEVNYRKMINHWDEDTPSGLQKKNYLIAAKELVRSALSSSLF